MFKPLGHPFTLFDRRVRIRGLDLNGIHPEYPETILILLKSSNNAPDSCIWLALRIIDTQILHNIRWTNAQLIALLGPKAAVVILGPLTTNVMPRHDLIVSYNSSIAVVCPNVLFSRVDFPMTSKMLSKG